MVGNMLHRFILPWHNVPFVWARSKIHAAYQAERKPVTSYREWVHFPWSPLVPFPSLCFLHIFGGYFHFYWTSILVYTGTLLYTVYTLNCYSSLSYRYQTDQDVFVCDNKNITMEKYRRGEINQLTSKGSKLMEKNIFQLINKILLLDHAKKRHRTKKYSIVHRTCEQMYVKACSNMKHFDDCGGEGQLCTDIFDIQNIDVTNYSIDTDCNNNVNISDNNNRGDQSGNCSKNNSNNDKINNTNNNNTGNGWLIVLS